MRTDRLVVFCAPELGSPSCKHNCSISRGSPSVITCCTTPLPVLHLETSLVTYAKLTTIVLETDTLSEFSHT